MTTPLLDELVIRLGLDTTPLQASAQQALGLLDSLDHKSQTLTEKLTRDASTISNAQSQLRRNALGLLSLAAGTRGLAALLQGNSPSEGATPKPASGFATGLTAERPKRPPAPLFVPLPVSRPVAPRLQGQAVRHPTGSTPKTVFNLHTSTALSPALPFSPPEKKPVLQEKLSKLKQAAVPVIPSRSVKSASMPAQLPASYSHRLTPPSGVLPRQARLKEQDTRSAGIVQRNSNALPSALAAKPLPVVPSFVTVVYGKKPSEKQTVSQKNSILLARNNRDRPVASSRPMLSLLPHKAMRAPQQTQPLTTPLVLPAPHTVLMQAAASVPVQPPAPVNQSTTTHIGPVTITVPSGNPQDIAAALRNLSTQNAHTLASLATRSTV
ncbi:hypothetical protein ACI01nite_15930 [Acetobacter cibinongensis]|uniref:Uncharacterized protein n=1 Tax=Acetobacter cibinongensis TaxID=146475 RepID=A0A0D6MZT3_9PROT|nr:hypothetical protein [Acetobacter cibinongensis]GAN59242.1 hypothetical protein Abci_003_005 [Acetobacter cibinongensis]GBQ13934.1 hypothetical protein AA0482_0760 [Acetobacter cibinongensis NRIC 0482]GEL58991.1 hypothetical protein ACI01nite_15930 [Acetobacter cibinongensis]